MVAAMARSRAGFFPIRSAFPGLATGRRPHCRFRGLLELYTRYGLPDRSPTIRGLCRGVPARPVSRAGRPPAIESNHQLFEWVLPPLGISPFGAHARPPALRVLGYECPDAKGTEKSTIQGRIFLTRRRKARLGVPFFFATRLQPFQQVPHLFFFGAQVDLGGDRRLDNAGHALGHLDSGPLEGLDLVGVVG